MANLINIFSIWRPMFSNLMAKPCLFEGKCLLNGRLKPTYLRQMPSYLRAKAKKIIKLKPLKLNLSLMHHFAIFERASHKTFISKYDCFFNTGCPQQVPKIVKILNVQSFLLKGVPKNVHIIIWLFSSMQGVPKQTLAVKKHFNITGSPKKPSMNILCSYFNIVCPKNTKFIKYISFRERHKASRKTVTNYKGKVVTKTTDAKIITKAC